jgi:hypothetical protein
MAKISEDTLRQIAEKKERISAPDADASWRMSSLLQTFNKMVTQSQEFLRYFPIAVVATLEGYFRARLALLIDSGEPFMSNAMDAHSEIKLDKALAVAIATRAVGLGEIITHSISINSFGGLIQVIRNISGRPKFLEEVVAVRPDHLSAREGEMIIGDADETWRMLGKVFETRHILCHELGADMRLDAEETRRLLLVAQAFIKASARWLGALQNPQSNLKPEERLQKAVTRRDDAMARLEEILARTNSSATQPEVSGELHALVKETVSNLHGYLENHRTLERLIHFPGDSGMAEARVALSEARILDLFAFDLENIAVRIEMRVRWEAHKRETEIKDEPADQSKS